MKKRPLTRILALEVASVPSWVQELREFAINAGYALTAVPFKERGAIAGEIGVARSCTYDIALLLTDSEAAKTALELLKERRKNFPRTPVLIVTNASTEKVLSDFLDAGASDFIQVPLRDWEVRTRFHRWLANDSTTSAIESLQEEFGFNRVIG